MYYVLTLKAPRKTASENVVCLCRLLNILADFSNLFLHTGKQCGPDLKEAVWSGSTLFAEMTFKITSRRQKADNNCCDWRFKGECEKIHRKWRSLLSEKKNASLVKIGLLWKKRICSQEKQICFFQRNPTLRRDTCTRMFFFKLTWAKAVSYCDHPLSIIRHRLSSIINNKFINTLEVTVLTQSWWNMLRMFASMKSRSSLILGHLGSKTSFTRSNRRKKLVNTIEVTVFKLSSWILLKMFALMVSRSSS